MTSAGSAWLLGTCLVAGLALCGCSDKEAPSGEQGTSGAPGSSGSPGVGGSGNGAGSSNGTAGSVGVAGSGTSGGSDAGTGGVTACAPTEGLKVTRLDTTAIATMGKPFDSDGDKTSPWNWNTNYGKPPEIVALPDGENLDILWQDHSADPARDAADPNKNAKKAFVVRVEKGAAGYAITRAYQIDQLAHIMGLAKDEQGNYFVATGVDEDEDLTPDMPGPGMHRPGIVKLVKFDANGCKSLEIDADNERAKADPKSQPVINPMVAATSRLAYHGGRLALLHGINVDYDPKVEARHQKALTTHFDSSTGAATLTDSMWVSHSFDQRLFWDGTGFVEVHLGDAYPRSIALGRFNGSKDDTATYELFKPKGDEGDNNTFTRLGGIAQLATGDLGYLIVFTTDRGTDTTAILNGTRDLAFLRVSRAFATMDEKGNAYVDGATTQEVMSSAKAVTNKLTWLTDYAADAAQADRPKVAAITGDQVVVMWERWTGTADRQSTFVGTQALVLGNDGVVKVMPKQIGTRHLLRGDDLVSLGEHALFVSGDGTNKKLTLNLVGADLALTAVDLP
ncbi:MAG TPA: hypothetical protein VHP33_36020 [Polyangiaceae bacterium]|nr:hypothetical protein [Polyangiaceae bacterium]